MDRILILDSQASMIKTELEPSQLAKVTLAANGFNLAINYVCKNVKEIICCSLVRKCINLRLQIKINRSGVIISCI